MRPATLVHGPALATLSRLTGQPPTSKHVSHLAGSLAKACRVWNLEALAPVVAASHSIVWLVATGQAGNVRILKLPLIRQAAIAGAHVALETVGHGPAVLQHDERTGALLLERVTAPPATACLNGEGSPRARRRLDRQAIELLADLAGANTPHRAETFTGAVTERLRLRALQPGRAAAAHDALALLADLASEAHDSPAGMSTTQTSGLCHGALGPETLHPHIGGPARTHLTGPRGVRGDLHADLAGWMLRTADRLEPVKDAAERAAEAATHLGWCPRRAESWVQVLSAAGLSPTWGPPLQRIS
jgi:hypothetical protein